MLYGCDPKAYFQDCEALLFVLTTCKQRYIKYPGFTFFTFILDDRRKQTEQETRRERAKRRWLHGYTSLLLTFDCPCLRSDAKMDGVTCRSTPHQRVLGCRFVSAQSVINGITKDYVTGGVACPNRHETISDVNANVDCIVSSYCTLKLSYSLEYSF